MFFPQWKLTDKILKDSKHFILFRKSKVIMWELLC